MQTSPLVVAALFAAVKAQVVTPQPCVDVNTKDLAAELLRLNGLLKAAKDLTPGFSTSEAAELKIKDDAKTKMDTIVTAMKSFKDEYLAAKTTFETETTTLDGHTTTVSNYVAKLSAASGALTAASAAVTVQNGLITTATTAKTDIDASVVEHTAEVTTLTADAVTKLAAYNTADTALTTATNEYNSAVTAEGAAYVAVTNTGVAGAKKDAADAATAYSTQTGVKNGKITTEKAAFDAWRLTRPDEVLNLQSAANYMAACKAAGSGHTGVDCAIDAAKAPYLANGQLYTTKKLFEDQNASGTGGTKAQLALAAKNAWVATLPDVVTETVKESDLLTAKNTADAALIAATALVGTKNLAKSSATTAKTNAKSASTAADTARDTAIAQLAILTKDQTHATKVLADLQTALTPLTDDVIVKTYLNNLEIAADAKAKADKSASSDLKTDYKELMEDGKKIYDQAMLKVNFYTTEYNKALAAYNKAKATHTANKAEVLRLTGLVTANGLATTAAVAGCKEAGYAVAQAAEKTRSAAATQRLADATAVRNAYAVLKPAAVAGGAAGTPCGYPLTGDKGTRPTCNDGLCCGAADKILLDGTKLTVETCQAEAATTYTFWPELPAGATVRPTPQTWRFYCISGAKQIAAAATTAMAAAYLMA